MKFYFTSLLLATCFLASHLEAAITFDRVFGSHMVIPQNKPIVFSGTAEPKIPVQIKWQGKIVTTTPTAQGTWVASFPPQKAKSTPSSVTATQKGETNTLDDILIGEVWLASGQSNMLWRLNQTPSGRQEIPASNNSQLRIFHNNPQVHTNGTAYTDRDFEQLTPTAFYQGEWQISSPKSSAPCSAVAYYFAKNLQQKLGIPVGIIHSSLGGSEMAAWLPSSEIKANPAFQSLRGNQWLESKYISSWVRGRAKQNISSRLKSGEPQHPYKPAFLYDAGIEWITQLPISGIIWYQGESDAESNNQEQNMTLMSRLIQTWQTAFHQKQLPFVMVQLPRINDNSPLRAFWPEFREMQRNAAATLPGAYCVNNIDLGSTNSNVHPPEKIELSQRIANLVLNKIYHQNTPSEGASLKKWIIKGNKMLIALNNAQGLKTTDNQAPTSFEIAGADKQFKPATASISPQGHIILSSPEVSSPQHARYAWASFVSPNLVNKDNLPTMPFCTSTANKNGK
ncbi:MAG: sialate O-acetylesterase [Akkermansia sp.]